MDQRSSAIRSTSPPISRRAASPRSPPIGGPAPDDRPAARRGRGRRLALALTVGAAALVVVAVIAVVWVLGLVTWEHHSGYLGPAVSPGEIGRASGRERVWGQL